MQLAAAQKWSFEQRMANVKKFRRARWEESIEIRRWARLQIMVSDLGQGIVAEEQLLHAMESYPVVYIN